MRGALPRDNNTARACESFTPREAAPTRPGGQGRGLSRAGCGSPEEGAPKGVDALLAAAPRRPPDWHGSPNVRLPIPIAAFKAQGRLKQLSADFVAKVVDGFAE